MSITTVLDIQDAHTAVMKQDGTILQVNASKATLKTTNGRIAQSAENVCMREKVGL